MMNKIVGPNEFGCAGGRSRAIQRHDAADEMWASSTSSNALNGDQSVISELQMCREKAKGLLLVPLLLLFLCVESHAQKSLSAGVVLIMQQNSEDFILVDVRSASEFQSEHIRGAVNIMRPFILKAQLPKTKKVVLYCGSLTCGLSHSAANDLVGAGYQNVMVLDGGIAEWQAKSYPVILPPAIPVLTAPSKRISARELSEKMGKIPLLILDVRPAAEFHAGHISNAISMPLEGLSSQIAGLDSTKEIVIYDRSAQRSQAAVKQFQARGRKADELSGGVEVWVAMKFPISI